MRLRGSVTPLLFLAVGLMWGASFLFIRVAVTGMSPVQLVLWRTTIATAVLVLMMLATGARLPRGFAAWRRISVLGVAGCLVPFLMYATAGQRIPSGLSSIYNASVPVATTLLTMLAMRQEVIGGRKGAGIVVGAIGIVIVLAPWQLSADNLDLTGQLACIIAVLGLGFAFAYTRKEITPLGLDPVAVAMGQMLAAAAIMWMFTPFTGLAPARDDPEIILSTLALGVLSTGIAYVANFRVIEAWGAASASMVTYLTTIVGVALGVVFLREQLTAGQLTGGLVVLAGVALSLTGPGPSPGRLELESP